MSMGRCYNAAFDRRRVAMTGSSGIWDYPGSIIIGTGGRLVRVYEDMKCTFGRVFVHAFVLLKS